MATAEELETALRIICEQSDRTWLVWCGDALVAARPYWKSHGDDLKELDRVISAGAKLLPDIF